MVEGEGGMKCNVVVLHDVCREEKRAETRRMGFEE